jgi:hypothetical protein
VAAAVSLGATNGSFASARDRAFATSAVVFEQIEAHFGFAQTPNVPREPGRADIPGLELDPSQLSFTLDAPTSNRASGPRWRERFYSGLARIATRSIDFFRIPPDRVIDLGAEVEILRVTTARCREPGGPFRLRSSVRHFEQRPTFETGRWGDRRFEPRFLRHASVLMEIKKPAMPHSPPTQLR